MSDTKGSLASKTVWTGVISAVLGVLAWFDIVPAGSKEALTEAALMVLGGATVIWRIFFTNAKIKGLFGGS